MTTRSKVAQAFYCVEERELAAGGFLQPVEKLAHFFRELLEPSPVGGDQHAQKKNGETNFDHNVRSLPRMLTHHQQVCRPPENCVGSALR